MRGEKLDLRRTAIFQNFEVLLRKALHHISVRVSRDDIDIHQARRDVQCCRRLGGRALLLSKGDCRQQDQ